MDWVSKSSQAVGGSIAVPGDKSISHRSVMLGSLAEGVSEVSNFLTGEDCRATAQAMRAMGVQIEETGPSSLRVYGVGLHGLKAPAEDLYLGNSGTSMRLFCGLLAGQSFDARLTGDESLSGRPMRRVTDPLAKMGAVHQCSNNGTPPVLVQGGQALRGLRYEMPMASAQVKSALLLAGLYAEGETAVHEPRITRDHSERMLRGMGYELEQSQGWVSLQGGGRLTAQNIVVPNDLSSAAFFFVAAAIQPGAQITVTDVGLNPTRRGVLDILQGMGARVDIANERIVVGEPVADVTVEGRPLHGMHIDGDLVALAIDELPVIFVAAACAKGETLVTGAEELRVKESDRVASMAEGLQRLGIRAEARPDGMRIMGGEIQGGEIESHDDHRIAMSFAVAGTVAQGDVILKNCDNVATSFPGFLDVAAQAGLNVEAL